ncbi:MAG: hypothetical protein ABJI60_18375 [Kangiellaceae bacterium]
MELTTVNQALENLSSFEGEYVYLTGLLTFEFEGVYIDHWPKSEQMQEELNESSVWLSTAINFGFNEESMTKMSGKRVIVGGTLIAPCSDLGGCGHMSGWPAEIVATQIHLHSELGKI